MRPDPVAGDNGLAVAINGLAQRLHPVPSGAGLRQQLKAADIRNVVFGLNGVPQAPACWAELAWRRGRRRSWIDDSEWRSFDGPAHVFSPEFFPQKLRLMFS